MRRVLLLAVLASAASAMGGLISVGDPMDGNSWAQRFFENGVGTFDFMAVQMISAGDAFESPSFRNFDKGGWLTTHEGGWPPTEAVAEGPGQTLLYFDIFFDGASSNALDFNFFAYNGSTVLEFSVAHWNGSGWSFDRKSLDGAPSREYFESIPAPGAALLGAIGLCCLGTLRRRSE